MKKSTPFLAKDTIEKVYLLTGIDKTQVEDVFKVLFILYMRSSTQDKPFNFPYFGQVSKEKIGMSDKERPKFEFASYMEQFHSMDDEQKHAYIKGLVSEKILNTLQDYIDLT